jgi:hypothetical protein
MIKVRPNNISQPLAILFSFYNCKEIAIHNYVSRHIGQVQESHDMGIVPAANQQAARPAFPISLYW